MESLNLMRRFCSLPAQEVTFKTFLVGSKLRLAKRGFLLLRWRLLFLDGYLQSFLYKLGSHKQEPNHSRWTAALFKA